VEGRERKAVIEGMDGEGKVRKENKNVGIHLKFLDIPIHSSKFLVRLVPLIPSILTMEHY